MTRIIAHRGYSAKYPEMTRDAYVNAIPVSDGFECDIQLTKDLQLICFHDDTMDRTTDMSGPIAEKTWAEISEATPQPILFNEFMQIAMDSKRDVLIETKHPSPFKGLLEEKLNDALEELKPEIDMSFMSFSPGAVRRMRKFPGRKVQLLEKRFNFVPKFHAEVVAPSWNEVDEHFVKRAHKKSQEVYIWTVNNPEVAKRLVSWGVDTLITDDPKLIRSAID